MNKPPYGNNIRMLDTVQQFRVMAQDLPNKTVKLLPGSFVSGAGNIVEFNGSNSSIINTPVSGSLWYLVSIGPNANVVLVSGITPPIIQKNHLACALVFVKSTDTVITNDMIFDVRPIYNAAHYGTAHNELSNNTIPDCHPMSAITGLSTALADKIGVVEFENGVLNKADVDGTISPVFILNKDQTGTPAENVEIVVERGNGANVSIRWNESNTRWEFTNDGAEWFGISNSGFVDVASASSTGTVLLSIDPVDSLHPVVVGDNDTRLLSSGEKSSLITHLTDVADPHQVIASLVASDLPPHDHIVTGGSLGAGSVGPTQLADLSVLDNHLADTLKYTLVRKTSSDVVSNVLTFNPVSISTPFNIGANAVDQLVVGLNSEKVGGKLAADFALNIDLANYLTTANATTTYAPVAHTHSIYALNTDLANYLTTTTANATYALSSDLTSYQTLVSTTFLTVADAAVMYAPKQTGVSGTFTTVDSKTITIVDGVVTSIV